jgi:hypothetical protein
MVFPFPICRPSSRPCAKQSLSQEFVTGENKMSARGACAFAQRKLVRRNIFDWMCAQLLSDLRGTKAWTSRNAIL